MRSYLDLFGWLLLSLSLAGCGSTVTASHMEEAVDSIIYDKIACADLIRQRNELADSNGLARDVKYVPLGADAFTIDFRSSAEKQKAKATAQIDAINRSLTRRACK
jgi:hypothetical protein